MSSTFGGRCSYRVVGTGRPLAGAALPSQSHGRIHARLFAVACAAATLAACAGPSLTNKSEWRSVSRQTPAAYAPHAPRATLRTARHIPSATRKPAGKTSSHGVASFYTEDSETASGEKFDPHQLTAAHRTLPFGTRLRVTNVSTGRSVTVRINDRGPFVAGRNVDLSYSAAETIGMVERGVTKVKLEVVR
jgi:peptidoglycan lytic transglycosylase